MKFRAKHNRELVEVATVNSAGDVVKLKPDDDGVIEVDDRYQEVVSQVSASPALMAHSDPEPSGNTKKKG